MKLQNMYTALLTTDLAAAEGWYTKLLGRRPDYRPMDTLVQWELFNQGGLMALPDGMIAPEKRNPRHGAQPTACSRRRYRAAADAERYKSK